MLGKITDPLQEKIYDLAVASQEVALNVIRPGVTAESIHKEYASFIEENGYDYPFRCGRATGFSFLEKPQLVSGDKTILKKGMVLAVDGSIQSIISELKWVIVLLLQTKGMSL